MNALTRRNFLRTGLAAAAFGATGSLMAPGSAFGSLMTPASARRRAATAPFTAYSGDSFFKSSVIGAPVAEERTAAFRSFMKAHPDQRDYAYPQIKGVGGNAWGTAYAMGTRTDPIWRLTGVVPSKCASLKTEGFHAPSWLGQMLTGTSDSPFCVIDVAFGFTMFAANAVVVGDRLIKVSSAGKTHHSSNGLHHKNPRSDDQRNFTSRGRISDAMVIRRDLVDYGIENQTDLGHVLQIFLVETRTADGFCHPMVGEEGGKYGFGAEGERIAIAPGVNLTKRGLSPAALVIARTLKNYGCYFGDNAGSGSSLKAEQETKARPVWNGLLDRNSLEGLTWDDFVVLPKGW
ncbi:MAG: hypothetical protein M3346_03760 [Actinomycetota bacterium]|nr:hypothetical protein [Actinomycetota bacterium]